MQTALVLEFHQGVESLMLNLVQLLVLDHFPGVEMNILVDTSVVPVEQNAHCSQSYSASVAQLFAGSPTGSGGLSLVKPAAQDRSVGLESRSQGSFFGTQGFSFGT